MKSVDCAELEVEPGSRQSDAELRFEIDQGVGQRRRELAKSESTKTQDPSLGKDEDHSL